MPDKRVKLGMVEEPSKTLRDIVKEVGQYPEDAFLFVREGLSYAAERIHGPETEAHRALQEYLNDQDLDWDDLVSSYHSGTLPEPVVNAIDAAGGCEKLNRHVSGREFCWALRDFALKRWGILARTVLESWRITNTSDFGRIVFGFIDFDMMRRQPDDTPEDFSDVYSFTDAFDSAFGDGSPDEGSEPPDTCTGDK